MACINWRTIYPSTNPREKEKEEEEKEEKEEDVPSSLRIATTATGSVADKIEETMNEVVQSHSYGNT